MTYQEIFIALSGIGVPVAYHHFDEGTGQQPPFICFYYAGSNDVYADNQNFQRIDSLIVELYTDNKNFTLEAATESVLASSGFTWTKEETYIDSEKMYEVIYTMEVVINGE